MESPRGFILTLVNEYLSGKISGVGLVRKIDDIVGDDIIVTFPDDLRELIDDLQDELAFFVRDEKTRDEAPNSYFGEDRLRTIVLTFREDVKKLYL